MYSFLRKFVDYSVGADMPEPAALGKLSPLMASIYRALYLTGDGSRAADELCVAAKNPWAALRMLRLIIRHESEWANPDKWKQLIVEIEKQTGPQAQHEAEQKQIEKLVWWGEVKAGLPDLPESDVFHIHPIGLVGNFDCTPQLITIEMLKAVDPDGHVQYHHAILPYLNKCVLAYNVTAPKRVAHFLSQISVEIHFKNAEEEPSYSAKRMKEIFGCNPVPHGSNGHKFSTVGGDIVCNFEQIRSKLWTQEHYCEHNPQNLVSYVYANRYGNGDEASGDGYKYRGKGLIQTTFRANYEVFYREHNKRFPGDQQDFVQNPDFVLSDLQYGVESAFVYWSVTRNINPIAGIGNVLAVTRKVNGGGNGYYDRKIAFNKIAPLLGLQIDET